MRAPATLAAAIALIAVGWFAWRSRTEQPAPQAPPDVVQLPPEQEPPLVRIPLGSDSGELAGGVPARWAERNRQALRRLEQGDLAGAVELLEECHAALPDEPVIAGNLAEALARLARAEHAEPRSRADAIAHLARAVEIDSTRGDLAGLLARWRESAAVEAGFWTDDSEHFRLSYDGDRTEILRSGYHVLLRELERAYQDFGELFGRFPVEGGAPKIEVVLYRREEFARLTGLGHWAGGVFDGRVRIPVEDLGAQEAELRRVLRHELVHAFVREVGGSSVPGWLNEGLAQWLEESFAPDRAQRVAEATRRLVGKDPFPLEKLRASLVTWSDPEAIARAYAQSLALVAHIERWYGERILFEMVTACGEGGSASQRFLERIGVPLDQVLSDAAQSWR